ncbi:MAG: hypothetical protein QOG62_1955 [Thermoleophilaceae bacterium]|jgi:diguanylate cyclase (GGDEF)-like protein|nr:hypothetical protein [Thermoleophilaceae bacterium]
MSFRSRLLIFFVIIVVVPMIAAGFVTLTLIGQSSVARMDSQITQAFTAATAAYQEDSKRAGNTLGRLAEDDNLLGALALGKPKGLQKVLDKIAKKTELLRAMVVTDRHGKELARVGDADAVAFQTIPVIDPKDKRLGTIAVSNTSASGYASEARRLTALEAQIGQDGKVVASTLPGAPLLGTGNLSADGEQYRGNKTTLPNLDRTIQLGLYLPAGELNGEIAESKRLVLILLLAFLGMALASSILVVRALQGQIGSFLEAARAIGKGDFDRRIQTSGNDEFAQLGMEFNSMSEELKAKIEEVERQRRELEESIRRVGEAFAAGLNAEEIVAVAVRTAIEACAAEVGRALPAITGNRPIAEVGQPAGPLLLALEEAERGALERDPTQEEVVFGDPVASGQIEDCHAIAATLVETGESSEARVAGVVAIARRGEPFSDPEREVFVYLASRAAVSFENASLHQLIQEQAITDPLTGLFNRRRFGELLANETARAKRLGHPLGLIMLDVDSFKEANDTHGHQTGDAVLEAAASLLAKEVREIDVVARFGGDEFVAILPETDLNGATVLAERIRAKVADLKVKAPDGSTLTVTASLGVASLPDSAHDGETLLAAADLALYEAKRAGKNRVSRSEGTAAPR